MEVLMGFHHVAVRVSDIERATRFYVEALDGVVRTSPGVREGPFAETVMGGTPGARFRVNHIDLPAGTVELFEFLEPVSATGGFRPAEAAQLHFALEVDDVAAALQKVEAAGGKRYWPEVVAIGGGGHAVYVTDPDGNVIELIDLSPDDLVAMLIENEPEMAP
jgi:catechol 2,3-dioxygenase-like lactoylglutathione lyase family enzyme